MIETFNTLIVYPLTNILAVFNVLFENLGLPGAFGLAIIVFTVFVRLILYPLYKKQNETTRKMSEIKPRLDSLKDKHKNDSARLQQEQIKLYQEAGINPAAGCVLVLIQIPLFLGLFQALNMFVHSRGQTIDIEALNAVLYSDTLRVQELDLSFLWLNLAVTPSNGAELFYLIVPVVTGVLQYYQANTVMIAPPAPSADEAKKKDKKPDTAEEFQRVMQMQMKYIFPFVIAGISYTVPVALALYWNVFSLFSIIQYYMTRDTSAAGTGKSSKSARLKSPDDSSSSQSDKATGEADAQSSQVNTSDEDVATGDEGSPRDQQGDSSTEESAPADQKEQKNKTTADKKAKNKKKKGKSGTK